MLCAPDPTLLSPDMVPHWFKKKRMEVWKHKMERKILGETMKDKVRNTDDGKRTSMWNTAAWADTHMEMGRTRSIHQPIKMDLCGYDMDHRIRKRNLGRLKSR
jgi:hypothetical protein